MFCRHGNRNLTAFRSQHFGNERFKPYAGVCLLFVPGETLVETDTFCSYPFSRGSSKVKSTLRLRPRLHQGVARRLRFRQHNRVRRHSSTYLHPHQHHKCPRHRTIPRAEISHKRCLVTSVDCRVGAGSRKRIRTQGTSNQHLGWASKQEPVHSSCHSK